MLFEFKHRGIILTLSIIAAIIVIASNIIDNVVHDGFEVGSITTFLVLGAMLLFIIGQYTHFENPRVKARFSFASYIVYLIIYGRYFLSTIWSTSALTENVWVKSVNSILGVFCALSFIFLIISLVMNSISNSRVDSYSLLKISGVLLLVFTFLFGVGDFIASSTSESFGTMNQNELGIFIVESILSPLMYILVSILIFFMTFFLSKDSKIVMRNKDKKYRYTKKPIGMTEKEKLDTLKKYQDLLDNGIITKEEFEQKKKKLI